MKRLDARSTGAAAAAPQGARSATGGAAAAVEVPAQARRRRFTAAYKLRILEEAEVCRARGDLGALLRREGLYSSHLTEWRKRRDRGGLTALAGKKRGKKPARDARDRERARLERENARLRHKLSQAEAVIEVQKKLSEILGVPLEETPERDESEE